MNNLFSQKLSSWFYVYHLFFATFLDYENDVNDDDEQENFVHIEEEENEKYGSSDGGDDIDVADLEGEEQGGVGKKRFQKK